MSSYSKSQTQNSGSLGEAIEGEKLFTITNSKNPTDTYSVGYFTLDGNSTSNQNLSSNAPMGGIFSDFTGGVNPNSLIQTNTRFSISIYGSGGSFKFTPSTPIPSNSYYVKSVGEFDIEMAASSQPIVEEFIFKIDTSLGDGLNEFQLKLHSFNSIQVDWGDLSIQTFTSVSDPLLNHTYLSSGQFIIKITGSFQIQNFGTTPDKLKLIDVINWGTNINTSFYRAFYQCSNLNITATDYPDLSSCTRFEEIFAYCTSLNYPLLSNWDVNNVQNFKWAFRSIPTSHDLSSWDVSSATDLQGVFSNSFAFDVSSWDVSNVTNLQYLCLFNSSITGFENWNVSNVTNTTYAFFGSSPVMDLSNWNLSSLTNASRMFQSCQSSFNVDSWLLPNLSNAYQMFSNSDNITGIPLFSSSLTNLSYTFSSNNNDFDLTKIDFQNVTNGQYAFNGAGLTSSSYQTGLLHMTGWNGTTATKTLKNNVSFHFGYAKYEIGGQSEDVRNYLINTLGWTITDGGGI